MKCTKAIILLSILLLSITKSHAQSPQAFSEMEVLSESLWTPLSFSSIPEKTTYQLTDMAGKKVIYAKTQNSASALITKLHINPEQRLNIKWRWKVSNIFEAGDAKIKSGDDYPARIYIAFAFEPESASFLEKLKYNAANAMTEDTLPGSVLNYIWANKLPAGEIITNPYSEQTKMIAVQSGDTELGQWLSYSRDIVADYHAAFGRKPPPIIAIGIMSDSDDTGETAEAWYEDIHIGR